jgi:hypothetical protein
MWWKLVFISSLFSAASASQVPLTMPTTHILQQEFAFKEGAEIFSPRGLVELARPGGGVANPAGDIVFVPVSKHSFKDKECVRIASLSSCFIRTQPIPVQDT